MPWRNVFSIWSNLLDQLCADFRYLDKSAMARFKGDRTKLIAYIAETHDLTLREAEAALEEWVTVKVVGMLKTNRSGQHQLNLMRSA
ncbi:MAG: hypothetical protein OXC60_15830 [Litoreibacter sp.]|nr:hypothetical protein [Litoreibacter sp.]MCY4336129.1 hypothetical protein [Litoreibacter sp.]